MPCSEGFQSRKKKQTGSNGGEGRDLLVGRVTLENVSYFHESVGFRQHANLEEERKR